MAKVTAPLFGFGASGQLGKSVVYFPWKGIKAARQYTVPSDPRSSGQVLQRAAFSSAVETWHTGQLAGMTQEDLEAWNRYAASIGPMSGFNAFVRFATPVFRASFSAQPVPIEGQMVDGDPAAMDAQVEFPGSGIANTTIHIGGSPSFFGVTATVAAVAGVATFSNVDTHLANGQAVYFWFSQGAPGADYARSGVYRDVLSP